MTRLRAPGFAALTAAVSIAAAGSPMAHAARGAVVLDAACPLVPEPAIRRIVAVELGDLLVAAGAAPAGGADRLVIRCAGELARLEASAAAAGAPLARSLSLAEFPGDAAPRALALAGVEMLAALSPAVRERIQARQAAAAAPGGGVGAAPGAAAPGAAAPGAAAPLAPPAAAAAPPPGPAPAAPPTAEPPRASLGVSLLAVRRAFLTTGGIGAWGGRAELDRSLGGLSVLLVDLEVDVAAASSSLGAANAVLASLGGFWGLRAGGPRLAAAIGAGGRAGLAYLVGWPARGSGASSAGSVVRPWLGPAVCARLSAGGPRVQVTALVEGGFTARGAEGLAGDTPILAASGGWLTAGLGARF